MEWQLRDTSPSIGTALLVTADNSAAADLAVREGADLLDVTQADRDEVTAIRRRHPGAGLAVSWPSAARLAGPAGPESPLDPASPVGVICGDIPEAEAAARTGVPREAILVAAGAARVLTTAAAGWAVVADVDQASEAVAAAAVCAWLGVAAARTRHVWQVRRALDMTASIRGLRPPAWAVRALA